MCFMCACLWPSLKGLCGVQAFYAEFGELMMRQPVIGLDFQSYLPIAILPYMLLLAFNVFNRSACRLPRP